MACCLLVWPTCLFRVRCYTKARIATGDLMNVLLIGAGGREHALAWALSASPLLTKLFCAPGNPGIAEVAQCIPIDPADHDVIITFCPDERVELLFIGPEAPLVAGLGDALGEAGIKYFGPTRAAAQLEGSK